MKTLFLLEVAYEGSDDSYRQVGVFETKEMAVDFARLTGEFTDTITVTEILYVDE